MYWFARFIVTVYCKLFNKLCITGRENIVDEGPVIIYCNHVSLFDVFLLVIAFKRPIHFMAKKSLFNIPVVKSVIKKCYAFPVDREHTDLISIKTALSVLRSGNQLGIFPEGTRSRIHKEAVSAKGGVAMFGIKSKATMIPVRVKYKRKMNIFNRFDVVIGKPIRWDEIPIDGNRTEDYAKAGEWLMAAVYEL